MPMRVCSEAPHFLIYLQTNNIDCAVITAYQKSHMNIRNNTCSRYYLSYSAHHLIIAITFEPTQAQVYIRSFAKYFVRVRSQIYKVVVFTESPAIDPDQVYDFLDPDQAIMIIPDRLCRWYCTEIRGGFFED